MGLICFHRIEKPPHVIDGLQRGEHQENARTGKRLLIKLLGVRGSPPAEPRFLVGRMEMRPIGPSLHAPSQNLACLRQPLLRSGPSRRSGISGNSPRHHTGEIEGLRGQQACRQGYESGRDSCQLKWISFTHSSPEVETAAISREGCRWRRTHRGWRCRCAGTTRGCDRTELPRCDQRAAPVQPVMCQTLPSTFAGEGRPDRGRGIPGQVVRQNWPRHRAQEDRHPMTPMWVAHDADVGGLASR